MQNVSKAYRRAEASSTRLMRDKRCERQIAWPARGKETWRESLAKGKAEEVGIIKSKDREVYVCEKDVDVAWS